MTTKQATVDTTVHPVDRPVHTLPAKRDRRAYFTSYKRQERLRKASPSAQLITRVKAILKVNPREYGPRLATVLTKFEAEIQTRR